MTAPTQVQQVRLLVGDVATDFPFLDDATYEWLLEVHPVTLDAAVEALEMIINQISLSPQSIKTDAVTEVALIVSNLERRLAVLKTKKRASVVAMPFIVKTDRSNWNDFDSLFRGD